MSEINRVGVVGCGLMGAGIAEVSARAGKDVLVVESTRVAADVGRARLEKSLVKAELHGKIDNAAGVLDRIQVSTDLDLLADRDLVVEAIVEDEHVKCALFGRLDKVVTSEDAVLASNTSSIPIMKLAVATERPTHAHGVQAFGDAQASVGVGYVQSTLLAERDLRASSLVAEVKAALAAHS